MFSSAIQPLNLDTSMGEANNDEVAKSLWLAKSISSL